MSGLRHGSGSAVASYYTRMTRIRENSVSALITSSEQPPVRGEPQESPHRGHEKAPLKVSRAPHDGHSRGRLWSLFGLVSVAAQELVRTTLAPFVLVFEFFFFRRFLVPHGLIASFLHKSMIPRNRSDNPTDRFDCRSLTGSPILPD